MVRCAPKINEKVGSAHPIQLPRQSLADIAVPGQELGNEKM